LKTRIRGNHFSVGYKQFFIPLTSTERVLDEESEQIILFIVYLFVPDPLE